MISLKRKQSGFTIVELLIVIVVIGILAAIVITTFTGVQKKGRDADRKVDVGNIASQAEVYFAENSRYPSRAQLNDATFREANMPGINDDTLVDPSSTLADGADPLTGTVPGADSTTYQYAYVTVPADCDNGDAGDCTAFTVTANLENDDDANYSKESSSN